MKAIVKYLVFAFLLISELTPGQIKLPRLISDGAVLQREKQLTLWGWASAGESVTLQFLGKAYTTKADDSGNWKILLPAQSAGGPYNLHFTGNTEIILRNILFGDVWVCSGQSNMELTMERVKEKYSTEIATSENTNIRQFLVPDRYDFKQAHADLETGHWETASPSKLLSFSAVAYFFAKELYDTYHVPIGLINAALGGSPAEAWMSEDALVKFPTLYEEAQRFKDDARIEAIETADRIRSNTWYADLQAKDEGLSKWNAATVNDHDWREMHVPGYWADGPLGNINGVVWFRKKIMVPKSMTGKPGKLWLGRLVDADSAFINGKYIGATTYQYPPRKYEFRADVLKEGENSIAVKLINSSGRGGFVPDKPYYLAVERDTLDLKGAWKYKVGAVMPALQGSTAIRFKPGGLYNSMISPLLPYSIHGVIWYQGESNTARYREYEDLFPALITNWREKWKQGDFPFLYVQLANFMESKTEPSESDWAALRQAQLKTLALPNTGMAVTIDVGEWNDIHPLDKQTVGKRLALHAKAIAYRDKNVVRSGPLFQSMTIAGNTIALSFSHVGSGLTARGGTLNHFAIAGADKKFVWAKAKIEGNRVIVWSDEIKQPVVVRYAWADNPVGANLYNREGLPASPFSTEKD